MTATVSAPVTARERITNLDTLRGVAVLGILVMNSVSFGLPDPAYFNLDAAGSGNWLDWVFGVAGEIFVDQKTMALFSALFGAGIVLFVERASAKGRRPIWFSLWRNLLLALIGLGHAMIWEGDILRVYALCAPVLIATRRWSPRLLLGLGTAAMLTSAVGFAAMQPTISAEGTELGSFWFTGEDTMSDGVGLLLLVDFFFRALGMMWIGVALYKLGVMQGQRSRELFRRMAVVGLGIGLPLATLGVVVQAIGDYQPGVALIGQVPNTVATIPIALGYLALISLWDKQPATWLHDRVRACGQMALTNYLTQTIMGVIVLGFVFDGTLGRAEIGVFILAVWALQLAWSKPWLDRFRFGPFEWLWRVATYRAWQPLRRTS
jgi:uncharacterized protein